MLTIVVPARGGSKGLPGKNLAPVGGIPLVGRAVRTGCRTLQRLGVVGRVVCTTDSHEIASVAREWGAEVPFLRSDELATDSATTFEVLVDVINRLDLDRQSLLAIIQPTSPLVIPNDVARAVELHRATGAPVVGVAENTHPPGWTFHMSKDGHLQSATGGSLVGRRQDDAGYVRICGAVYVSEVGWLLDHRSFIHESTRALLIPDERAIDIDSASGLMIARGMLAQTQPSPIGLGGVLIGPGRPPIVIAEAGVNHNGRLDLAKQLIDAACAAGAGAVKFQTFKAESVVSPLAEQAAYQRRNTGLIESQFEMIRRLELSAEDTVSLRDYCQQAGIIFLSSPFDRESCDLLVSLGVPALKVGSGEITNHRFLAHLAGLGLPLLVSTGMSTLSEVAAALDVIESHGAPPVSLLHCVSSYPAPPAESNLAAITTLREAFGVPVGWSDHSHGLHVSVAAAALGACVIEKHFTLDRTLPGPDHKASLEPDELAELVRAVHEAWSAQSDGIKRCMPCEEDARRVARRSLFAVQDIPAGTMVAASHLAALRPGTGISSSRLGDVIGRPTARDVLKGKMLSEEDFG